MNISDYVIDYLNAFVVSEQLTEGDVLFHTNDYHKYFLYVERICNLKVCTYGKLCAIYVDCSKNEMNKLREIMDRREFQYNVRECTKYKSGYISDFIFEIHLYKEELAKRLLDVILEFLKGERI
ncbi:hypothetical protein D3C87_81210 [compost metagenome]